MLSSFIPMSMKASTESTPISMDAIRPPESAYANTLIARLDEINTMDKSNLRSSEKRKLRKEVRSIKRELKAVSGGGVYLSVGAIIIIILLLILLL